MSQYDTTFDLNIHVSHCDLYFMVQWFCLISWIFDVSSYILWDNGSVWHDIWPQNICRSLWLIFHGLVILLYILKTIWYMNTIRWDYESVWSDVLLKINVGLCDLYFMVQWFALYLESYSVAEHHTLGFWVSYNDPKSCLTIFVGHCDLYFMVHWICLISWRLFDVWTLYFVILN